MLYTSLRIVNGSIMLLIPPIVLKKLGSEAGKTVSLDIQDGMLVVKQERKTSYKLANLLAEHQIMALEQNAWEEIRPIGREEI